MSAHAAHPGGDEHGLEVRQQRRALRLLRATGSIMVLLGVAWGGFFVAQGARFVALTEFALAVLGVLVLVATRQRRVRLASWTAFLGLFVFLCLFSARLDVETAEIPRTSHLFLLVLAICAHHVFRGERAWLRYGCVGLFLAAFALFAGMPDAAPPAYAIPDHVRRVGIWVNLLSIVASLLVVLHVQEHETAAHRSLHRALRDALSNRQFELHYQPQIDAQGRVVGAEALLRWRDPKRGLVAPGEFVRAAEDTGFILPLGLWVLTHACTQLSAWRDTPALQGLRLSVNVSALQLRQPDFVAQVLDTLDRSGADRRLLTLELTESVVMHDMDGAVATMRALHDAGVRLSLDDFGTGYSSLSYLRQMPLSELKIDRAFVAEVTRDTQAAAITRSLLTLGRDLGIDVIAEGIEQQEQYEFLRAQECVLFQGYLFGRPMEREAFERMAAGGGVPSVA